MKLVPLLLAALPTAFAQVVSNVALNKPTSYSVEYSDSLQLTTGSFPSRKATDGNAHGDGRADYDYNAYFVGYDFKDHFVTAFQDNPWWEVDLQEPYEISQVIVYNRELTAPERLAGFQVVLKLGGVPAYTYTYPDPGTPPVENIINVPPGIEADSVRVQIPGVKKVLQIDEVKVMGRAPGGGAAGTLLVPVKPKGRRHLRGTDSDIIMEEAQNACASLSEEDRDSCIFDVLAIKDKDMAGVYLERLFREKGIILPSL